MHFKFSRSTASSFLLWATPEFSCWSPCDLFFYLQSRLFPRLSFFYQIEDTSESLSRIFHALEGLDSGYLHDLSFHPFFSHPGRLLFCERSKFIPISVVCSCLFSGLDLPTRSKRLLPNSMHISAHAFPSE